MRKRLIMALMALVFTPAAVFGFSSNAWALDPRPKMWVNHATLLCLDSNATGSVYTLGCNGGNFQLWMNSQNQFGYEIKNNETGRCLDSNTDGNVYTLPCNGGNFQRWSVISTDRGFEIRNVATLLCLDSNTNGNVYTLSCNGGNFQRWD